MVVTDAEAALVDGNWGSGYTSTVTVTHFTIVLRYLNNETTYLIVKQEKIELLYNIILENVETSKNYNLDVL